MSLIVFFLKSLPQSYTSCMSKFLTFCLGSFYCKHIPVSIALSYTQLFECKVGLRYNIKHYRMGGRCLASFLELIPWSRDPNCNGLIFYILFEVVLCQVSSGINSLIPCWNPCQPQPNCRVGVHATAVAGIQGKASWIVMLHNEALKRLASSWHITLSLKSIRIIRAFADWSI